MDRSVGACCSANRHCNSHLASFSMLCTRQNSRHWVPTLFSPRSVNRFRRLLCRKLPNIGHYFFLLVLGPAHKLWPKHFPEVSFEEAGLPWRMPWLPNRRTTTGVAVESTRVLLGLHNISMLSFQLLAAPDPGVLASCRRRSSIRRACPPH